jgi:hypothetical protein
LIDAMAASLDPGSSAGFLLVEHVWARDLKRAIRQTGGFPIGEGFLTPEEVAEVAAELVACPRSSTSWRPRRQRPERSARAYCKGWRRIGRKEAPEIGILGRTGRNPDADAAEIPDRVAHAAAAQLDGEQDGDAPGLRSQGGASRGGGAESGFRCPEPEYMAELERLAQLRDQGIVSEEEFEAKEKQILGL